MGPQSRTEPAGHIAPLSDVQEAYIDEAHDETLAPVEGQHRLWNCELQPFWTQSKPIFIPENPFLDLRLVSIEEPEPVISRGPYLRRERLHKLNARERPSKRARAKLAQLHKGEKTFGSAERTKPDWPLLSSRVSEVDRNDIDNSHHKTMVIKLPQSYEVERTSGSAERTKPEWPLLSSKVSGVGTDDIHSSHHQTTVISVDLSNPSESKCQNPVSQTIGPRSYREALVNPKTILESMSSPRPENSGPGSVTEEMTQPINSPNIGDQAAKLSPASPTEKPISLRDQEDSICLGTKDHHVKRTRPRLVPMQRTDEEHEDLQLTQPGSPPIPGDQEAQPSPAKSTEKAITPIGREGFISSDTKDGQVELQKRPRLVPMQRIDEEPEGIQLTQLIKPTPPGKQAVEPLRARPIEKTMASTDREDFIFVKTKDCKDQSQTLPRLVPTQRIVEENKGARSSTAISTESRRRKGRDWLPVPVSFENVNAPSRVLEIETPEDVADTSNSKGARRPLTDASKRAGQIPQRAKNIGNSDLRECRGATIKTTDDKISSDVRKDFGSWRFPPKQYADKENIASSSSQEWEHRALQPLKSALSRGPSETTTSWWHDGTDKSSQPPGKATTPSNGQPKKAREAIESRENNVNNGTQRRRPKDARELGSSPRRYPSKKKFESISKQQPGVMVNRFRILGDGS